MNAPVVQYGMFCFVQELINSILEIKTSGEINGYANSV